MSDWVSVKDRLPEEYSIVIVFRESNNPELKVQTLKWFKGDESDQNITHWMPLPEPPKGEELRRRTNCFKCRPKRND